MAEIASELAKPNGGFCDARKGLRALSPLIHKQTTAPVAFAATRNLPFRKTTGGRAIASSKARGDAKGRFILVP
jgi:hypothetical protein